MTTTLSQDDRAAILRDLMSAQAEQFAARDEALARLKAESEAAVKALEARLAKAGEEAAAKVFRRLQDLFIREALMPFEPNPKSNPE